MRKCNGIWTCKSCRKVVAGGAYVYSTTATTTVRSTIQRNIALTPNTYPNSKLTITPNPNMWTST